MFTALPPRLHTPTGTGVSFLGGKRAGHGADKYTVRAISSRNKVIKIKRKRRRVFFLLIYSK
jgi:hypothetical protein